MKDLSGYLANENVQAFLAMLRDAEGTSKGADPYRVYGGSAKNQLESLDTPDFKSWGFTQTDGKKKRSTATGAYQFLEKTWKGLEKNYGLTDFSPRSQDLGAVALLSESGALKDILNGDFAKAISKANKTWASLPGSPYAQKTRSNEFVSASLQKALGQPIDLNKYTQQAGIDFTRPAESDAGKGKKQHAGEPNKPFVPSYMAELNNGEQIIPESEAEEDFLLNVGLGERTDKEKERIAKMGALFKPNTYDINFTNNKRNNLPTELDQNILSVIRGVS